MQNIYGSTNREPFGKTNFNMSGINYRTSYSKDRLITIQKRDKLKGLLITKFMKKYGIKNPEVILEEEIKKFLEGEKLTDADLKRLDEKIKKLLFESKAQDKLKRGLSQEHSQIYQGNQKVNNLEYNLQGESANDFVLPDLNNDAISVRSKTSKVSKLSKNSKQNKDKFEKSDAKSIYSDLDDLESVSCRRKEVERFDFEDHKDEWNAIVAYNRKLYEEEQKQNKMKDLEIKRRIREDLDNQIRQKMKRTFEENIKNKEYDDIIMNHCSYLDEVEKRKQQEIKERIMKEKENRDKQLLDEKHRKKVELMKEKKYDKETVKNLLSDIEREKQNQLKKRIEEKEFLQQTLRENEINRLRLIENAKREKLDDIKATEEYSKILDRQEQERVEYFKKIERNSNNFINKMSETVLTNIDKKNKEEEDRMKMYLEEKERRMREEDEKRMKQNSTNKKLLKEYLDMQVDEKKRAHQFERGLDGEQARIWKIDTEKYFEQEKDIQDKVRSLNNLNSQFLKNQIDNKHIKKTTKMNDTEFLLNQNLLEKIKNSPK